MHRKTGTALIFISTLLATLWTACGSSTDGTTKTTSSGSSSGTAGNTSSGTGGETSSGLGGGFTGTGTGGKGTGGGVEGCNPQTFTLQQAPPPEVYLVIDRSGSMNDPGATMGMTKWDELKSAADTALTQFESQIHFGVLLYPTGQECQTSGPQVAFADNNKQAIMNEINNTVPAGGTPTAAALNNAAASLSSLGSLESPKFVILATDGGPNCNYFLTANPCTCTNATPDYCCTNFPGACFFGSSCLDDKGTLDTIKELKGTHNIDTFVIGLAGTDEYKDLLNQMAKDGGRPQQGGMTDYYAVADQAQLLSAMQTIAVSVISCQNQLESAPQVPDGVSIYVDGKVVPHDKTKTNGWDYTDDTHTVIELYGAACEGIQDGEEHKITATFECEIN